MRRAIFAGLALDAVALMGWIILGEPIFQRGVGGLVLYLTLLILFIFGFAFGGEAIEHRVHKIVMEEVKPEPALTDKAKMREAVLGGVLEAIKGLVVRSENAEREIKELKTRMSEISLAAGLKPRTAMRPFPEPKP